MGMIGIILLIGIVKKNAIIDDRLRTGDGASGRILLSRSPKHAFAGSGPFMMTDHGRPC